MKRITTIILAVILLLGTTACGSDGGNSGNNDGDNGAVPPFTFTSPEELAQKVMEEIEIPGEAKIGEERLNEFFPDLDITGITDFSYYICASGFQPDELFIARFLSAPRADNAKADVEVRLESRKGTFADYSPEEMYKLESAVIYVEGMWLFFIVTEDNVKAKQIIDKNK